MKPQRPVLSATAVTVTSVLPLFLVGAHAVQLRESLSFNQTALGGATAAFLFAMALSSMGCGRLADRVGAVKGMRRAALMAALASLWLAVAANSWGTLVLGLIVCGVANGLAQSSASLLLVTNVPEARQGLAFGVFQSAKPAATMVAGLSVPLVGLTLGWRYAFIAAAVLAVAVSLLLSLDRRPAMPQGPQSGTEISRIALLLMTIGIAFGFAGVNSLATFLVDASTVAGYSSSSAGLLLALGGGLAVASRLMVGHWADLYHMNYAQAVSIMLLLGAVGHGLLATESAKWMLAGVAIASTTGWAFSGIFFLALVRMHSAAPGAIAGVALASGSLGGALGPALFGLIVERQSYTAAWLCSGAWGVVAAVTVAVGGMHDRRGVVRGC